MTTGDSTIEVKSEQVIDVHPGIKASLFIFTASLSMGALVWAIFGG